MVFIRALYSFLRQTIKTFGPSNLLPYHILFFRSISHPTVPRPLAIEGFCLSLAQGTPIRSTTESIAIISICVCACDRCSEPLHARSVQEAKVLTAHPLPFILVPCDWSGVCCWPFLLCMNHPRLRCACVCVNVRKSNFLKFSQCN